MRPLKSNVASAILGRNWVTRTTGFCAQISTGPYLWLLRQRKYYYSFWRIKIRCYNNVIYCTKHVSLHNNQSGVAILSCESCHQISCCILRLAYMTRHEGSKVITFKPLQFFGGVFYALIEILIYHNVYLLTKNC